MQVRVLLLAVLLLVAIIPIIPSALTATITGGGGGGATYGTYSHTITLVPASTTTQQTTSNGANLDTITSWLDPCYIVVSPTEIQILPDQEYINNNGTFSLSTSVKAINVTFTIPSGSSPYGAFGIGYGADWKPAITNYLSLTTYAPDGIIVWVGKGTLSTEHMVVYFNGQLWGNFSIGSLSSGVDYTLGFTYSYPYLYVYWYNGSWYKYTILPETITSTGAKALTLTTLNDYFDIAASNGGPTYGYAEWNVVSYSYLTSVYHPPVTATFSWTAVTLSNGIQALYGFTGADNPVNVSTNATSYSILGIVKVVNYSVTGSIYSVSGSVSYTTYAKGLYLLLNVYPSGNVNSWYLNVTIELQFVTSTETVDYNLTVPVFVSAFAFHVSITIPQNSYIAGQTITITNTTEANYPPNLGYAAATYPKAEINIEGLTSGYVPLPYAITANITSPTTYTYIINVEEDGFTVTSYEGSFTVYPNQKLPAIFVTAPSTATYGSTIKINFQFTYNAPVANITSFEQQSATFGFDYMDIVSSTMLIELNIPQAKYGALVFLQNNAPNIFVWFNGSSGVLFSPGVNTIQLTVTATGNVELTLNSVSIDLNNKTDLIGIGIYNATFSWLYEYGAVLQGSTANQAYTILIGQNPSTLQQYASGYTNASGWGSIFVPIEYSNYELIDVYWAGVKYTIINITVIQPTTTTTTTVNTTTLNYNYTKPFSNNIAPNSQLYDFSSYQPWATVIGLVVVTVVVLMGWKFGGKGGAAGGAVMGIIVSSYLGLLPWYIYYIFIFAIAMLIAKLLIDKFMGGEEV